MKLTKDEIQKIIDELEQQRIEILKRILDAEADMYEHEDAGDRI